MKVSKMKLKKKLEQVNRVCNMDFKMQEYGYNGFRAVSECSDVYSLYGTPEDVWYWRDAFMQGWIIRLQMVEFEDVEKEIAEEMHQEEMKKGLKKRG